MSVHGQYNPTGAAPHSETLSAGVTVHISTHRVFNYMTKRPTLGMWETWLFDCVHLDILWHHMGDEVTAHHSSLHYGKKESQHKKRDVPWHDVRFHMGKKNIVVSKKRKIQKDFKVLLWPPNSPHFNLNGHLQGFSCLKMGLCILTVNVTTTRSHMIKTRDTLFKCKSLHLPVFYNHMTHTVSMLLFDGLVRETLF